MARIDLVCQSICCSSRVRSEDDRARIRSRPSGPMECHQPRGRLRIASGPPPQCGARNMPIRLRLALAFAAAAALLFAVGGWLFSTALSAAQLGAIDSQLTAQLAQAARYLPGNGTGPRPATAANPVPGEYITQVVDSAGRVRGASPDAGTTPLLTAAELGQIRQAQAWATRAGDEEDTGIPAPPLAGHPGLVAVAAVSLETYDATQRQALRELATGGGIFVAIAGLGAYWLTRAALSPVERLRRQVAAISGRG